MKRALSAGFLLVLATASAAGHERPVIKTMVRIDSRTIARMLEPLPERRAAKIVETQNLIAQHVAARLNEEFSFVTWAPENARVQPTARLSITIEEKANASGRSTYYLRYRREIFAPEARPRERPLDYGTTDPLYKAHEEKPLGSSMRLGTSVALKVASHFQIKRQALMEQFLSQIPLCHRKPTPEDGHTFLVHVPLEPMRADSRSVLEIRLRAKPEGGQPRGKEGTLVLTPLRLCNECDDAATRGTFKSFFFPGIGDLKDWDDRILNVFGETRLDSVVVVMSAYWSVDDDPPLREME